MHNQNDNREIRVFISSTFKDMEEEREYLIKITFPKLRSICEQRSVTFTDIDLRWGITDEQARDGGAIAICLEEIDRCRPYFIGLIGERYGWTPQDDNVRVCVKPEIEKDVREWCDTGRSVTEMEMLYGVLKKPEQAPYSYFYFCDLELTKQKERRSLEANEVTNVHDDYFENDSKKRNKLKELKNKICNEEGGWSVDYYATVEELGQKIEAELLSVIDKEFPEDETIDAISLRHQKHEAFARGRRRGYIADESEISHLIKQIEEKGQPLVITGEIGVGKSALMAILADRLQKLRPKSPIIAHYAGAGDDSSVSNVIRQILAEINQQYQLEKVIPNDQNNLFQALSECLSSIPEDKPLYLILDGLNQYTGDTRRLIAEIPGGIGLRVRIVLSALASDELDYLKKREWPQHIVQPLKNTRRVALIESYLGSYNKTLPNSLLKKVSKSEQCGNPLYLKILLDELRVDAHHEVLSKRIEQYLKASTTKTLYQLIITRWEKDYGKELTVQVLCLIWLSRFGLSYDELRHLVDSNQMSISCLIFGMGNHIGNIGGLYIFMHDALRQAVEDIIIYGKDKRYHNDTKSLLSNLIGYFAELDIDNERRLDELARLYHKNKQWKCLQELLTNLAYLYWKFRKSKADDLLDEYQLISKYFEIKSHSYIEYESFIKKNFVVLKELPSRVYQEAMNLSKTVSIKNDAESWCDGSKFDWGEVIYSAVKDENMIIYSANRSINCFDWSPSGKEIVVLLKDGNIYIVDVENRKVRHIDNIDIAYCSSFDGMEIEWNPSNEEVIGLMVNNWFYIIRSDGNIICECKVDDISSRWVYALRFSAMTWSNDGNYFLIGCQYQYEIRRYYENTGKKFDDKNLVTQLKMFNVNGEMVDNINIYTGKSVASIEHIISFDDGIIVSTNSGEIHKVHIVDGKLKLSSSFKVHDQIIRGISLLGGDKIFVLCLNFEKSMVIDINTMEVTNQDRWSWENTKKTRSEKIMGKSYRHNMPIISVFDESIGKTVIYLLNPESITLKKLKNVGDNFKFEKNEPGLVAYNHGKDIVISNIKSILYSGVDDGSNELIVDLNKCYFKVMNIGLVEVAKTLHWSPSLKYRINYEGESFGNGGWDYYKTYIDKLDNSYNMVSRITVSEKDMDAPIKVAWNMSSDLAVILFSSKLVIWDVNNQNEKWVLKSSELHNYFTLIDPDDSIGWFHNTQIKWSYNDRYLFITWYDGLLKLDINSMEVKVILSATKYKIISALDVIDNIALLGYMRHITVDQIIVSENNNSNNSSYIPVSSASVIVDSGSVNVSWIADGRWFLVVTNTGELTVWERLTLRCILRYKCEKDNITAAYYNHENGIVTMMSQCDVISLVRLHLVDI